MTQKYEANLKTADGIRFIFKHMHFYIPLKPRTRTSKAVPTVATSAGVRSPRWHSVHISNENVRVWL